MFTADVFSDVANGVNLVLGPAFATSSSTDNRSSTNMNMVAEITGASMQGKIKKAHPIWGTMTITIPLLPMLQYGISCVSCSVDPWSSMCHMYGYKERQVEYLQDKMATAVHVLLLIPFTIIATPWYISYVICTGFRRLIWPSSNVGRDLAAQLRRNEVLLESSLQTCLGM